MFPGGQVGPVNAGLCTGYTDPQRQTDENSCRTILSRIENAITNYCSDNSSAAECADSGGNPALLANLPSYDQLPNGVRDLLPQQDYLGRLGFDTAGAAANVYSAITKGKAPVMWEVGKVWAGIIEDRLESGGSVSELEQEVNTGYILDPLFGNVYRNDISRIETREVLEHAYRHPAYYQLLYDNGFPVPFAMNDFDPATTEDDDARNELNEVVDRIKRELSREWRNVSEDSDSYKQELARRIFDWLIEWKYKNGITGDSDNEYPDYEAYELHKGDCSEMSAILYYLYEYAGLEPVFLMNQDFEPTLSMLILLDQAEKDHVMVGLPQSSGRTLAIDPTGEMFDVRFTDSIETSPLNFALGTLSNTVITSRARRDIDTVNATSELYLRMAPDSLEPYFVSLTSFLTDTAGFNTLTSDIERNAADHPMADYLMNSGAWYRSFLSGDQSVVDAAETVLNDTMRKLEAQNSHLAAFAYTDLSSRTLQIAENISRGGLQFGNPMEAAAKLFEKSMRWLAKSVTLNPNDIFAVCNLYKSVHDSGKYADAAEFFDARAAQYPTHSLFQYFAARLYFLSAMAGESPEPSDSIEKAIGHAQRLISIEPQSPIPYLLLAYLYFSTGREDESLFYWNRGKDLLVAPYDRAAVMEFIKTGLILGRTEDIASFFEDRPSNAIPDLLYNKVVFEMVLTANENYVRAAHNVFETIKSLLEQAQTLPDVDLSLIKATYLKYAMIVAIMEGVDAARNWFQATGDPFTPAVQSVFDDFLSQFNRFLRSGSHCDNIYLKNLYDILSVVDLAQDSDKRPLMAKVYVGLASRFIRAEEPEMARICVERARAMDEETASAAIADDQQLSDFVNGTPDTARPCRTFFGIRCDVIRNLMEQHGN